MNYTHFYDALRRRFRIGPGHEDSLFTVDIDLILVLLYTIIMQLFIYYPYLSGTVIRPFLGITMVLFVPGYSLTSILFPGKANISGIERFSYSFGLSIAVVPLIGLCLNITPIGINLRALMTSLSVFVIVCIVIANIRRHMLPSTERFSIDLYGSFAAVKKILYGPESGHSKITLAATILVILATISVSGYFLLTQSKSESYTEFYILGPNEKMQDYSTNLMLGSEMPIAVGIVNHEQRRASYNLTVSIDGNLMYTDQMTVENNETWQKSILLKPSKIGTNMKMSFLLYIDGDLNTVYRECILYVNVTAPARNLHFSEQYWIPMRTVLS